MIRVFIFLCSLFAFSTQAVAATATHTGKVTNLRAYSDGPPVYDPSNQAVLNVYVQGMPGACGGSVQRTAIHAGNPLYYSIFSMVMTAYSENRDVTVEYATTCTISAYSWDLVRVDLAPPAP